MTRLLSYPRIVFASAMLCLLAPGLLFADDGEGDDSETDIKVAVQGPVQVANCTATPPTLQILGLTIDVSQLVSSNTEDRDNGDDNSQGDQGNQGDGGGDGVSCAGLVGQTVRLNLASDQSPLTATSGQLVGGYSDSIFVQGPIQAIDTTGQTLTVLGLTISVTSNGNAGSTPPKPVVDLTTLMVGQEVKVILVSATPPLVAEAVIVSREDNGIELQLSGGDGGDDQDECDVDEVVTNPGTTTTGGTTTGGTTTNGTTTNNSTTSKSKAHTKLVKKTFHFHKSLKGSNGHVSLHGLPAGKASITIRRAGKVIGHKTVTIKPHVTQSVLMHLRGGLQGSNQNKGKRN